MGNIINRRSEEEYLVVSPPTGVNQMRVDVHHREKFRAAYDRCNRDPSCIGFPIPTYFGKQKEKLLYMSLAREHNLNMRTSHDDIAVDQYVFEFT